MSVLVWRHGTARDAAVEAIRSAVQKAGFAKHVTWTGNRADARYGPWASVAHVVGEVTDEAVVIERCGGLAGAAVLRRCREMLDELFPGGDPT